jgi:hypothetical protein
VETPVALPVSHERMLSFAQVLVSTKHLKVRSEPLPVAVPVAQWVGASVSV